MIILTTEFPYLYSATAERGKSTRRPCTAGRGTGSSSHPLCTIANYDTAEVVTTVIARATA